MNTSKNLPQKNSNWIKICILFLLILALPIGLAFAHDYQALERKLGQAVAEGNITMRQANIMLDALWDSIDDEDEDDEDDDENIPFNKLPKAVRKAAKKITAGGKIIEIECEKEDGKLVYEIEAIIDGQEIEFVFAPNGKLISKEVEDDDDDDKKQCTKQKKSCDKPKAKKMTDDFDLKKIGEEIKAAVQAGKITAKQGWEKWNWVKKNQLAPRLQAARKAGKMTAEQVKNVWREIEKAEFGEHLKSLVTSGKLTEKQAHQKLQNFEKKQQNAPAKKDKPKQANWDAIKKRIEGAVKRGDMTRKEANAKYAKIKKGMAHSDKDKDLKAKHRAVAKKIRAAVQAGEMTEEQGRKKMEAYKRNLNRKNKKGNHKKDTDAIKRAT